MMNPPDEYELKWQNTLANWLHWGACNHLIFKTMIIRSETIHQENGQVSITDTIAVAMNDDTAIDSLVYHRLENEPPLTTIQVLALLIEAVRTIDIYETTLEAFYHERNYHDDEQEDGEGMDRAREDYDDLQMRSSILKKLLPEKEIAFLINEFQNISTDN